MVSQGPTPFTIHHHLQMIHEQKVDVVVMLTRLVETAGQGVFDINNVLFFFSTVCKYYANLTPLDFI
jgi:protein tyrosine phosphatase